MPNAQIAVFESRPKWTPLLRWELAASGIQVRVCRKSSDLLTLAEACQVQADPLAVVIDFESGAGGCLPLAQDLSPFEPRGVIALGTAATAVLEPSLRELGVTSYHPSSIESRRLALECQRILTSR